MIDKPRTNYAPTIEENYTAAIMQDEYASASRVFGALSLANGCAALFFAALTIGSVVARENNPSGVPIWLAGLHLGLAVAQHKRHRDYHALGAMCMTTHDFNTNSYRPHLNETLSEHLGLPATQKLRAVGTTAMLVGVETGAYYLQATHGIMPWDLVTGLKAMVSGMGSATAVLGGGCSLLKSLEPPLAAGRRAEKRFCANHPVRFS